MDWWRVEAIEPGHPLRLSGRAWLEFELGPEGDRSTIRQTAIYDPVGLLGIAYWYASAPFHFFVFGGMLRRIKDAAEAEPV